MAFRIERTLDDVGWRILAALQEDARLSFSALGRRVGLSPPAAAERVRRLEDAGIITGYRVELDLEKLGFPMTAVIRVSAPEEKFRQLKAAVQDLAEVLECHHVTGADSLVLRVAAVSVAHLERVIEALGRHGTPTTAIVLSSPVPRRAIHALPSAPVAPRSAVARPSRAAAASGPRAVRTAAARARTR
jgi:Lrp/AsnC family transcriptional regulator, leucine-responsive regulatory protein